MKQQTKKRRGTVAVLVALALTSLIAFLAIALDGGLLQDNRRSVQAAADASALAAAQKPSYANYQTGQGLDPNGTAAKTALDVASANGYNNDTVHNKVTVNIPPASGIHQGQSGYAEVIVEYQQPRFFSAIWGSGSTPVRARAVAIGQWTTFNNGIMVLDPTLSGALTDNGSGSITVADANVIVNSNSPSAAVATGGGTITAPYFYITGVPGTSTSGVDLVGNIIDNQTPTPDPLAYLPAPDPSTMVVQSKNQSTYSGSSAKTVSISPGVYNGGIKVSGQVTLNMAPGIYYMDGGGFSFTGQGNLNATGVMVYSAPKQSSDVININGNGQINFTPPSSGPYAGMALWQQRSSTNTLYLTGNGTSQLYGTVYAQHGLLNVQGNGAGDVLGSQYISYDVGLGGNGQFFVSWRTDMSARTRLIYLVE